MTLAPITVSRLSTPEERQSALYCIYQQVLERQPYSYERKQLKKAEKEFLSDKIGVRRFLKELGHSPVYLNAFYHNSSNMKFLERCFKHFLGRAPLNQSEIEFYCDILMHKGVAELITALLDSEEYRKVFGCFTVPHSQVQRCYATPRAYLESQMLNHELFGRRGRSIPTIYWHQLGLNCEAGVCRHPEADMMIESALTEDAIAELLQLLEASQEADLVNPWQKDLLHHAI